MQIAAVFVLALGLSQQVESKFSFEKTFKPPERGRDNAKSDDCEVLERSNFSQEDDEDFSLRFGNVGKHQPQLVYYPFMFNAPWCCNRNREITVKIQKGASTTSKPEVFCPGKYEHGDVGVISDMEMKFLSDYLDDVDSDSSWDYLDESKTTTEKASGAEEIVIKIVEKSPPCTNFDMVSDKFNFFKVKVSDVIPSNHTCNYTGNDHLRTRLHHVKKLIDVASHPTN